jgi:hypothetical protein
MTAHDVTFAGFWAGIDRPYKKCDLSGRTGISQSGLFENEDTRTAVPAPLPVSSTATPTLNRVRFEPCLRA